MTKKRIARLIAASLAVPALALAACGASSEETAEAGDGDSITLEFPTWQAEDQSFAPWWNELIAAYEDEHPNVTIDFYQIPFDSYVDQITTRFAAGDEPEIVHLPARNAAEFASRGWLAALDERLADTDILESWTPLQEEMQWDGQNYGVLLLGYGYALYYNEQLLADAGVDVPTTADELVVAAEAITGDGVFGFGATTQQNPDNFTELASFIVGNGHRLATADGQFTADTAGVVESMDQYRQALANAPAGIQSQQRNELFLNGNIAMVIDGPFFLPELEGAPEGVRDSLRVAAPPFEVVPGGVSNSVHMPAGIEGETADAVWAFIEIAASPEWQERYAELAAVPAPREGSVTEEATANVPELELFQQLADEAVTIYPTAPEHRENFGRISDSVSQAAIRLISTDEPTSQIASALQDALEGSVR